MRLNTDIKQDVYDEFSVMCEKEGRSISDVIRELIIYWISKKKKLELIEKAVRKLCENKGDEQV